jgi:excisionase family DNA binding protein
MRREKGGAMSEHLHTVEEAAERLKLHPKTVLRLIRSEKLRATKIGKSYRILRSDLDAFSGAPNERPSPARVTMVVDVPEVSGEASARLATMLQATLAAQTARNEPVHLTTAYDPTTRVFKIVVVASPADAAALLQAFEIFRGSFR